MSDEELAETLTKHGKQFCPLLRFEVTEQEHVFRLTDEQWSWSLYFSLAEMTAVFDSPLDWVEKTFKEFNDGFVRLRDGIISCEQMASN